MKAPLAFGREALFFHPGIEERACEWAPGEAVYTLPEPAGSIGEFSPFPGRTEF